MSALTNLAMNSEGFSFDPASGACYTMNMTAVVIVEALRRKENDEAIAQQLTEEFEVTLDEAVRDIADFRLRLRTLKIV